MLCNKIKSRSFVVNIFHVAQPLWKILDMWIIPKYKPTLLPETTTDTDLVWSVCNESIATVDEHGTVTAQGPGNCVVTAATPDGALKATYSLTVKANQTAKAASNIGTVGVTSPSYSAPNAPTEAPAPAPDPEPAPAEPSQPSGDSRAVPVVVPTSSTVPLSTPTQRRVPALTGRKTNLIWVMTSTLIIN